MSQKLLFDANYMQETETDRFWRGLGADLAAETNLFVHFLQSVRGDSVSAGAGEWIVDGTADARGSNKLKWVSRDLQTTEQLAVFLSGMYEGLILRSPEPSNLPSLLTKPKAAKASFLPVSKIVHDLRTLIFTQETSN